MNKVRIKTKTHKDLIIWKAGREIRLTQRQDKHESVSTIKVHKKDVPSLIEELEKIAREPDEIELDRYCYCIDADDGGIVVIDELVEIKDKGSFRFCRTIILEGKELIKANGYEVRTGVESPGTMEPYVQWGKKAIIKSKKYRIVLREFGKTRDEILLSQRYEDEELPDPSDIIVHKECVPSLISGIREISEEWKRDPRFFWFRALALATRKHSIEDIRKEVDERMQLIRSAKRVNTKTDSCKDGSKDAVNTSKNNVDTSKDTVKTSIRGV